MLYFLIKNITAKKQAFTFSDSERERKRKRRCIKRETDKDRRL